MTIQNVTGFGAGVLPMLSGMGHGVHTAAAVTGQARASLPLPIVSAAAHHDPDDEQSLNASLFALLANPDRR